MEDADSPSGAHGVRAGAVEPEALDALFEKALTLSLQDDLPAVLPTATLVPPIEDVTLEQFLKSQGLENEITLSKDAEEFSGKFQQLKTYYSQKLDTLNKFFEDTCAQALSQLLDGAQIRLVNEAEVDRLIESLNQRFETARRRLKITVFEAIANLQRQFHLAKSNKSRRALDKRVTETLYVFDGGGIVCGQGLVRESVEDGAEDCQMVQRVAHAWLCCAGW